LKARPVNETYDMGYNAWSIYMLDDTQLHLSVVSSHDIDHSVTDNKAKKIFFAKTFEKLTLQADKVSNSYFIDSLKYEWTKEEIDLFPQTIRDNRTAYQWQAGDRLIVPIS